MKTNRMIAAAMVVTSLSGVSVSAFANHAYLAPEAVISKQSRHIDLHAENADSTASSGSSQNGDLTNSMSTANRAVESGSDDRLISRSTSNPRNTNAMVGNSTSGYTSSSFHRGG